MLAAPFVRAQTREPDRVRIIGYLAQWSDPKLPLSEDLPLQRFRKLGWIEGQNIVTERRFAESKFERLPELAQDLIRKRAEVILTGGAAATLAAARATRTIPIVFFGVPFPAEQGLVDSFARPGRNVTGTSTFVVGMGAKRFEFLRDVAPAAKRVYVTNASEFSDTVAGKVSSVMASLHETARRSGFDVKGHVIRDAKDVEASLAEALSWGAQALAIGSGTFTYEARHRISEFALHHRLPSTFTSPAYVEAGGLLSYGISNEEYVALITRSLEYVDRVLRGARPSDCRLSSRATTSW